MTIDELIQKFEEIYNGKPWHGTSVRSLIVGIDERHFNAPVSPKKKTIAHLLEHMLAWRGFAIEKLKGNESFDIPMNSESDWPEPIERHDYKIYYLDLLDTTQKELLELIKSKNNDWLSEQTLNKSYQNDFLLQGVIEHDIYHSGQIGIFHSLLNT